MLPTLTLLDEELNLPLEPKLVVMRRLEITRGCQHSVDEHFSEAVSSVL